MFSSLLHFSASFFFFFNDTATTEIYTLSLHDALPISSSSCLAKKASSSIGRISVCARAYTERSEEHTSELQSRPHLVCRLLLEKKKKHEDPRPLPHPGDGARVTIDRSRKAIRMNAESV